MKITNIYWLVLLFVGLGSSVLLAMDETEENVLRITEVLSPEIQFKRSLRDSDIKVFPTLLASSLMAKHNMTLQGVLDYLIEYGGGHSSIPEKAGFIIREIDRLDRNKTKAKFDSFKQIINNIARYYGAEALYKPHVKEMVEWLVQRGALMNAGDARGRTPLVWAVHYKNPDLVATLLNLGADPDVRFTDAGKTTTLFDQLTEKTNPAVAQILALLEAKRSTPTQVPASSSSSSSTTEQPQPSSSTSTPTGFEHLWFKEDIEPTPKMSLEEFKQKIAAENDIKTLTIQELRPLTLDTEDEQAIAKIQLVLDRIDALDPSKDVKFVGGTLVGYLIKTHTVDHEWNQNPLLLTWVTWFLDRGVKPDALDVYGHPLLIEAIEKRRTDIVELLMSRGANPTLEIREKSGARGTPLYYAQIKRDAGESGQKEIVELLLKKPTIIPSASSVAPTSTSSPAPSTQTITDTPPAATQPSEPKPTPPPSSRYKAFTRTKALLYTVATAVTLSALYKWFTGSYAGTQEDILVNNTGKTIWVSRDNLPHDKIDPGNTLTLQGVKNNVSISLKEKSVVSDLFIDLAQDLEKRKDNSLNLFVSKNWLSWLFGPLSASPHWVAKKHAATE